MSDNMLALVLIGGFLAITVVATWGSIVDWVRMWKLRYHGERFIRYLPLNLAERTRFLDTLGIRHIVSELIAEDDSPAGKNFELIFEEPFLLFRPLNSSGQFKIAFIYSVDDLLENISPRYQDMSSLVKELGFPITSDNMVWVRKATKFLAALEGLVEEEGNEVKAELEAYADARLAKLAKKITKEVSQ